MSTDHQPDGTEGQANASSRRAGNWLGRVGFWAFMFFLIKGLLWLLIPALLWWFARS